MVPFFFDLTTVDMNKQAKHVGFMITCDSFPKCFWNNRFRCRNDTKLW